MNALRANGEVMEWFSGISTRYAWCLFDNIFLITAFITAANMIIRDEADQLKNGLRTVLRYYYMDISRENARNFTLYSPSTMAAKNADVQRTWPGDIAMYSSDLGAGVESQSGVPGQSSWWEVRRGEAPRKFLGMIGIYTQFDQNGITSI